jgi:hypothetical protein
MGHCFADERLSARQVPRSEVAPGPEEASGLTEPPEGMGAA